MGYPLAFCDGVCKCREGSLNAGSACISGAESGNNRGSCAAGQTYVSEIGVCLAGIRLKLSFLKFLKEITQLKSTFY